MAATSDASRRRISGEAVLFAGLLVLHLVPIWAFRFFPTQDGPGHQALSFILRQYAAPGAGLLRRYFALNREALPNEFIFFLTNRVLGFLAVPAAEKVLLSAYVLLLPLSVRYTLRGIDEKAGFLAVLSFPFVYNYTLHMGFFNFCFSLPAFFFTVGYWLRHGERMTPVKTAALALLVLWVYFCHPVTLVMTVAAVLTLAAWPALLKRGRGFGRRLLAPALACLPALVLMASFVGRRAGSKIDFLPLATKIEHLAALYSLASLDALSVVLAAALALLLYILAFLCLRQRGRRPPRDPGRPAAGRAGVPLRLLPGPERDLGRRFRQPSSQPVPVPGPDPVVGAFEHPPSRRRWAARPTGAGLRDRLPSPSMPAATPPWTGVRGDAAAGDHIAPDHTFLSLSPTRVTARRRTAPLSPSPPAGLVHAGGYVAAEKRLVDLSLYKANEDYFFPLYYRPGSDPPPSPVGPLGDQIRAAPPVKILAYPRRTGGGGLRIDLGDCARSGGASGVSRQVLDKLAAGYEEVAGRRAAGR